MTNVRTTVLMLLGILEQELKHSAYSYDYKNYILGQIKRVRGLHAFKTGTVNPTELDYVKEVERLVNGQ